MVACVCGHESLTEGELMIHIIECHSLSYGLAGLKPVSVPDEKRHPEPVAI